MSIMRCEYCECERDTDFKSDCECEKSILIEEIIDIIGFGRREELECKAEKIIKLFELNLNKNVPLNK